jgi:5-(carboxyamino)imidazole ribonucleotide mutase
MKELLVKEPRVKEPRVLILMGSKGDADHGQKIADAARAFGLEVVMRIGSAHKTPEHVLALLREYEADSRALVYITVAGRSNALSGFVDGAVTAPVIACPPPSDAFGGMDLLSSLRMPSSIASAVVLDPANAALLAAKILGLTHPEVRERVRAFQKEQAQKILDDDKTEQANDKRQAS